MNEYALYFIKSGDLFIEENGKRYSLHKNDMLILEPGLFHQGFREATCNYYYLHFRHNGLTPTGNKCWEEIREELIQNRANTLKSNCYVDGYTSSPSSYLPKHIHCDNSSELLELLNITMTDFYNRYESYRELASWRLSELLLKISREYINTAIFSSQQHLSKSYTNAAKLLNYLNCNYSKKITSAEIEAEFDSNYDYLNRVFQKLTGTSIFGYLNTIRIAKAKELILTSSLKFTDIAYLVGIDDPYYFSRFFKKATGMTPTQYLNLHGNPLSPQINHDKDGQPTIDV